MKASLFTAILALPLLISCQAITPQPTSQPITQTSAPSSTVDSPEQRYPNIITATLTLQDDGGYTASVTVSSPYDTPERYADAWRILAPNGTLLGERILLHDHATEQPFTRTLTDLPIPSDIITVTIQGRDQHYGYGGQTVVIPVPHPPSK